MRSSTYSVQASGSTNATITNVATSYEFTFVNDIGQESGPSLPSATILRPDGVSVTVTSTVSVPTGVSADYSIETKRIYRSVTGAAGSIFRFALAATHVSKFWSCGFSERENSRLRAPQKSASKSCLN